MGYRGENVSGRTLLRPNGLFLFCLFTLFMCCAAIWVGVYHAAQGQETRPLQRPRNLARDEEPAPDPSLDPTILAAKDPGPVPKEDQLYVFALPEKGTQSVLILRVVDGDTCEGAFLVPVMFRLRGINTPEMRDKGGRPAKEYLEKLVTGRLLSCNLFGREKYGRILMDSWLPDQKGWVSEAMIKAGHAKPYAGGKRE